MSEQFVTLPGPAGDLEAGWTCPDQATAGLVIAHPHPLYGGSMDNNVVLAAGRAAGRLGWAALRFNFRGVGASQGGYADGIGEAEDLLAAVDWANRQGLNRVAVAAYSFGSWAASMADWSGRPLNDLIWIAPPVGLLPIELDKLTRKPGLILAAANDYFCPRPDLDRLIAGLKRLVDVAGPEPQVKIRQGADHFFGNSEDWLVEEMIDRLTGAD